MMLATVANKNAHTHIEHTLPFCAIFLVPYKLKTFGEKHYVRVNNVISINYAVAAHICVPCITRRECELTLQCNKDIAYKLVSVRAVGGGYTAAEAEATAPHTVNHMWVDITTIITTVRQSEYIVMRRMFLH